MTLSRQALMTLSLVATVEAMRSEQGDSHGENMALHKEKQPWWHGGCPYGSDDESRIGGTMPFNCHGYATGEGSSCPALQAARLKTAKIFNIKNQASFLEDVGGYPLSPVFDKSKFIRGDETHEELMKLHIQGLKHPEMEQFEDKIYLKTLAERIGIPTTKMYFGVHADEWKQQDFINVLGKLCNDGVDDFMIKATHLAWSAGQKIVTHFQEEYCNQKSPNKEELSKNYTDFIEREILNRDASAADEHLQQLKHGVTVESLFKTGGKSIKPLEAKVQVLWGKVYHVFFFGMDARGCRVNPNSWFVYGDKTGWDLKGIVHPGGKNDAFGDRLLEEAWQLIVNYAERFARSVEADFMRVDFFLRAPEEEEGGDWVIEMNECESVTGHPHTLERQGIGAIWRDGYILSRLAMDATKYQDIRKNVQADRKVWQLD